ncbi:hypothetical protein [Burkholderia territorii]|uniref:hypothetical protein n=1 Tax=Burkholderia territorii TaxID=1503055 RepID=UPI0007561EA4|nr:hypothetical protein [Burkholderia territorii]
MEPIIEGSESQMIAENISKPTLGLFENMSFDRVFEKLSEITNHAVDDVRDIGRTGDSNGCWPTSWASATHKAGAEALEISR